jgi:capsular polysaccharide export protein
MDWPMQTALKRWCAPLCSVIRQGRFFVKTHPDVIAGKKKGYLTDHMPENVHLIDKDCNPIGLLQQMDHVFTVTSQMGFEALMVGKPVTCWGMPFYAGWGLTEDKIDCPRRNNVRRSLEQVFAAAYLNYVRYVDPISRKLCGLERILDLIEHHKAVVTQHPGKVYCFGFRWWKRGFIHRFVGTSGQSVHFLRLNAAKRLKALDPLSRIVVWGASQDRNIRALADSHQIGIERVEDGFIRGVGLGSNFAKPTSLIVDPRGIYFDPQQPSELEHLLNTVKLDEAALKRAKRLRQMIVNLGISKYNTGCGPPNQGQNSNQVVILVPGQVEDDASIRTGCVDVRTNIDLLTAVRQANPTAYIIYKPHPDVVAGNRIGAVSQSQVKALCDEVVVDYDISACIDRVQQVHTMTSLTGFEALLRDKMVYTYGLPFYAGWGLTIDRHCFARPRRRCSIYELIYCALVLYPRYYDWNIKMFVCVEDALKALVRTKNLDCERIKASWWRQLGCKAHNLIQIAKLSYKR